MDHEIQEERPQGRSVPMSCYQRRPTLVVAELYIFEESSHHEIATGRVTNPENVEPEPQVRPKSFETILKRLKPQTVPETLVLGQCTTVLPVTAMPLALQRVCNFIKLCSLDFQAFPGDGRIDLRAPCLLSFSVSFWKRRGGNKHVIVELQRRQGCAIRMQRYRKAFVNYIRFGTDFDPDSLGNCTRTMMMPPRAPLQGLEMTATANRTVVVARPQRLKTLDRCHSMLESGLDDEVQLGLENLLLLLTSAFVAPDTVVRTSESILSLRQQQHATRHSSSLLDDLSFFLVDNQQTQYGAYARESSCDFEAAEFAQGHEQGVAHNLALQVLVSALDVAVRKGCHQDCIVDVTMPTWKTILCALCYNVCRASSRPQEAAISARCLCLLDTLTPTDEVITALLDHSLYILPCLFAARKFGAKHNAILERETCELLRRIEEVV